MPYNVQGLAFKHDKLTKYLLRLVNCIFFNKVVFFIFSYLWGGGERRGGLFVGQFRGGGGHLAITSL